MAPLDPDRLYGLYMAIKDCQWNSAVTKNGWTVERDKCVYTIHGAARVLMLKKGSRKTFLKRLDKMKGDDTHVMESWYYAYLEKRPPPLAAFMDPPDPPGAGHC